MTGEASLLEALKSDPGDESAWLVLADCLEEDGRLPPAELMRLSVRLRGPGAEDPERPAWEARLQELLRQGVRPVMPTTSVPLDETVALTLALIPPGTFWMGSREDESDRSYDEIPSHRVRLTRGFWIGIFAVTQAQWQAVMHHNPSHYQGADRPVEMVSWHDATAFCRCLAERTGRAFRLPREAEWEYACRAGTSTGYHFGPTLSPALANYNLQIIGERPGGESGTTPVGRYPPNAFGLRDLHGNVWECCADFYEVNYYRHSPVDDPTGPESGGERVFRGGSYRSSHRGCRSAFRGSDRAGKHDPSSGLRVVMDLG